MYITPLSCLLSEFIPLPLPKNRTLDWLKTFFMLSTATHQGRPKTYILSCMSHSQTDYPVPPISVPDTMLNCSQKSCEIDIRKKKGGGGGGEQKSSMKSTKVAAYTIKKNNLKQKKAQKTPPFLPSNTHHFSLTCTQLAKAVTISASLSSISLTTHQSHLHLSLTHSSSKKIKYFSLVPCLSLW